MVATKGQTTAAQPNTPVQFRQGNNMLDAQTLADRRCRMERKRWQSAAVAALWVPDGQHYVEDEARGHDAPEKRIFADH